MLDRKTLLAQHRGALSRYKSIAEAQAEGGTKLSIRAMDTISSAHVSDASLSHLQPISIKELRKDAVHEGRILWGTLIVPACKALSPAPLQHCTAQPSVHHPGHLCHDRPGGRPGHRGPARHLQLRAPRGHPRRLCDAVHTTHDRLM